MFIQRIQPYTENFTWNRISLSSCLYRCTHTPIPLSVVQPQCPLIHDGCCGIAWMTANTCVPCTSAQGSGHQTPAPALPLPEYAAGGRDTKIDEQKGNSNENICWHWLAGGYWGLQQLKSAEGCYSMDIGALAKTQKSQKLAMKLWELGWIYLFLTEGRFLEMV